MKHLFKRIPIIAGLALFPATLALAQQNLPQLSEGWAYGHMGSGMGWGGWIFGPLMMIFFIALLVGAVVLTLRLLGIGGAGGSKRSALDLLAERFARGEIDKAEFEDRRHALNT